MEAYVAFETPITVDNPRVVAYEFWFIDSSNSGSPTAVI